MNNVFVGEDIILPRSLRSQKCTSVCRKNKNLNLADRGRHPDDPFLNTMILKGSP